MNVVTNKIKLSSLGANWHQKAELKQKKNLLSGKKCERACARVRVFLRVCLRVCECEKEEELKSASTAGEKISGKLI